jgi:hypothetical protein
MSIAPRIRLWGKDEGRDLVASDIAHAVWLSGSSQFVSTQPHLGAVGLRPIVPRGAFIGVAIVPMELGVRVAINGTVFGSGLHGLKHADRVDVNGHRIWIAASLQIETTAYDPAIHGEHVYCYISKLPIVAGQEIVRCPGVPGTPCNVIYAKESWERAMQTNSQLSCANCKFRPDLAEWRPNEKQAKRRIDDILESVTNTQS